MEPQIDSKKIKVERPQPLEVLVDNIPQEIKDKNRWVVWRWTWNQERQRWDKPPMDPKTGFPASSTNPQKWSSFELAYTKYKNFGWDGIGFCLDGEYVGIDFDDSVVPETGNLHSPILADLKKINSYSEYSPSGEGVKTICRARILKAHHPKGIGIFQNGRYFCITGHALLDVSQKIEDRQQEIDSFCKKYWPEDFEEKKNLPPPHKSPLIEDTALIQKIRNSKQAPKFEKLWGGDWNGFPSQSEGDLALCSILAFWCGNDASQIDKLFRQSGLYRPERWDKYDYAARTIRKAISQNREIYEPSKKIGGDLEGRNLTLLDLMLNEQEKEIIEDLKLTDAGIAEGFNKLYGGDFRFMQEPIDAPRTVNKGFWIFYNDCKWEAIPEAEIRSMILGIIRTKEIFLLSRMAETEEQDKARRKKMDRCLSFEQDVKQFGVLNQIKTLTHILSSRFDQDDWLLGCENAVIDLKKGLKKPSVNEDGHPVKNYIFKSTSVEYDPMADCPRWIKFLSEIFLDDKELVDYIQMVVGYVLTGSSKEQAFFILYGDGENGKSTFLEVLLRMMRDYGQSAEFKTFCEKREEYISNEVWRMQGKRFIRAVEIKQAAPLNVARLQAMTGTETMTARGLYRDDEDFQFKGKIFLGVNHPPIIPEMDRAIERRIHFIPFKAHFPKNSPQRDDQLQEKLLQEKSGILNWAIFGCLKYQWACEKFGSLPIPEIVRLETRDYVLTQDQVKRFMEEMTEEKIGSEVGASELYESFTRWCLQENESPMNQIKFGRRFTSLWPNKKREKKRIFYLDLQVKTHSEEC